MAGLAEALSKTRLSLTRRLTDIFRGSSRSDLFEDLFEILVSADMGVRCSTKIIENLKGKNKKINTELLEREISSNLLRRKRGLNLPSEKPAVILITGVNGAGKTTTIGKLAFSLKAKGEKVLLAACDTFRAAGIEQLEIWAGRAGAKVIKHSYGADPAAVAYDALRAARARDIDVLIIDTAGRLHTKSNLMDELKKIKRVLGREMQGAPHETLLVLDATVGQNGLIQAKTFNEALDITGIILAKLDGTAKGGIIIAIEGELNTPLKLVGTGEGIEDISAFSPEEFTRTLFS